MSAEQPSTPTTQDAESAGLRKRKESEPNGHTMHEDIEYTPTGWLEKKLAKGGSTMSNFFSNNAAAIKIILIIVFNLLVMAFFFACLVYFLVHDEEPLQLCHGFGSLIALLSIIYFFVIYFLVVKRLIGAWFQRVIWSKVEVVSGRLWRKLWFRFFFIIILCGLLALYLVLDTVGERQRLISLSGIAIFMFLGFAFSSHPGRINWGTVGMGFILQIVFGLLFIRWDAGRIALQCFSDKVATFLHYGVEGASFVFGNFLVFEEGVFAFSTLPVIFFFSMLVELLFFWGALQWFCLKLGYLLRMATRTTVCESVICVGNVFLGMTESVLLIKPYIAELTASEVHLVMASGFATVSGTILAAYISFGANPAHLITASVMSAPAAICFAKLMMPETKKSLTSVDNIKQYIPEDQSALSAATRGATNGIALILNIIANLVAFVATVAFINGFMSYLGGLLGFPYLNMEWLLGKIFIPFSFVMGVPWEECELVGTLIGLKTVVNEFVAYQRMGEMIKDGLLSARAEIIATYALCGFTNPASAGIMIGALASMAPNQRETMSSVAVRAFFSGCGICFITAAIAGLLMQEGAFR